MFYIIKETSSKRGDKWTVDSRELHQGKMFLCLDDAVKHLEKLAQYYEHRTDRFCIVTRSATRRAFSAHLMNSTGTLVFGAEYYAITKAVFYDEP